MSRRVVPPHRRGEPWSYAQVNDLWDRLKKGANITELAREFECSRSNLYGLLREAGHEPTKLFRARQRDDVMASKIYTLRMAGKTFEEIGESLGMEKSGKTTRCLYMRLVRYCERAGAKYPRMPKKRKKYAYTPTRRIVATDEMVEKTVKVLDEHAARSRHLNNTALKKALQTNDNYVRVVVAEMRRRRLLADGLAPTQAGVTAAEEIGDKTSVDIILAAVVSAWTSGRECEGLGSLMKSTGFCRSTVNVAIIKLRDQGLLFPRGFLILRKATV